MEWYDRYIVHCKINVVLTTHSVKDGFSRRAELNNYCSLPVFFLIG